MGRLFDSPVTVVLILVVILLLFGAPKLPGMARSLGQSCLLYTSPSPRDRQKSRMPSSA